MFFLPGVDEAADRDEIDEYDRLLSEFGAHRAQVLGVVKATARDLRELSDSRGLAVPLLADAGGDMARDYGVMEPNGDLRRVTILADENGEVVRRFDPAPPDGQAAATLAAMRALGSGHLSRMGHDPAQEEPPG